MTHTPTPWLDTSTDDFNFGHVSSEPDGYGDIATTWHNPKENAAFIVRAVNSFDAMLEALEHARHAMWEYGFAEDDLKPVRDAIELARQL